MEQKTVLISQLSPKAKAFFDDANLRFTLGVSELISDYESRLEEYKVKLTRSTENLHLAQTDLGKKDTKIAKLEKELKVLEKSKIEMEEQLEELSRRCGLPPR